MAPWLIFCFTVILLHIERMWLLKTKLVTTLFTLEVQISIKMKNFKTFYESQTATCLKEIIQLPPDRSFLRLWNKNFRTEIYRNIQIFDCNWIRTQNHLVRKRTLNHLAKLESSCSQLTLIFRACFEQEVAWYSGNYRVWIHSERRTWHEKNIQSPYKCTVQIRIQNTAQSFGQFGQMVECSFTN